MKTQRSDFRDKKYGVHEMAGRKQPDNVCKACVGYYALFFFTALLFLFLFANGTAYSQGLVVMAKKVSGDLSPDPGGAFWSGAYSVDVSLVPQVMAKPRIYESGIKKLSVRAVHNTREIAFLLEWDDKTKDAEISGDLFSDAVALEFPSSAAQARPHFAMGDKDNAVNIWYWKAAWQEKPGNGIQYAMVDDFLGGVMAGNPVSQERPSPVQNIIAEGYGTATDMERSGNHGVRGGGVWKSDKWAVVLIRALASDEKFNANFSEGGVTPVSFAVWNGSDRERGGRKVISTWYYVGLETEERKTTYIYPVIAFIVSAAILAGIVIAIRKRRKV